MNNTKSTQVEKTTIIDLSKGKLPPQAIDLEEAVLGAMMNDRIGLYEAMEILTDDVFYKSTHSIIFQAIRKLFTRSENIDLLTVSQELKSMGKLEFAGGDFYLIQLTQKISSSAHIEFHCRILQQKYIQRKIIGVSDRMICEAYNEDADALELLENGYKEYGKITEMISIGKNLNFKKLVTDYFNKPAKTKEGVPSSIRKLHEKLNGYQNSDLIILAARPGMGKTCFVLNELLECGIRGIPAAFFSLEMSAEQLIGRLLAIMSGINIEKINHNNLTSSEILYLKKCSDLLSAMPIHIDDTAGISPMELKIKLNKLKRENGIRKAFVDYLQLMKVKDKKVNNRENEISEISQSLKGIAKDLNIPVTALSQLSRAVETRGSSKRPLLSDLRDSGSIEQDADVVMFIYRPEYYKIDEWDDEERSSTIDQAEIEIAKYRHGKTGVTRVGCQLQYMRFMDIDDLYNDLTAKYFRNTAIIPEKPKELNTPHDLPKLSPTGAFGKLPEKFPGDEDEDVPF